MADNIKKMYRDLIMVGLLGATTIAVPTGMKFLSIINPTDNTIIVYQDRRRKEDDDERHSLVKVTNYSALTVPLNEGQEFTFIHRSGTSQDPVKKATLIFSNVNLNINGTLGNPLVSTSVNLATDSIGLARSEQFPSKLTAGGNLSVEVQNSPTVKVEPGKDAIEVKIKEEVEVKNDVGNPLSVKIVDSGGSGGAAKPPSSYGQQTSTVGTANAAMVIPYSIDFPYGVMVMAHPDNTGIVYIGNMSTQALPLAAGAALQLEIAKGGQLYAKGSANNQQVIAMWGVS